MSQMRKNCGFKRRSIEAGQRFYLGSFGPATQIVGRKEIAQDVPKLA